MQRLLEHYTVQLDKALYAKDPAVSDIGKDILHHSVILLAEEGLEAFTFKKLAQAMASTETTIYRYFHNKHQLMMYLCSWYWSHQEWKLVFATANISEPKVLVERAVEVLISRPSASKMQVMNEELLQRVVCAEFGKVFDIHTKHIEDFEGYFAAYHNLCERISAIILLMDKNNKHSMAWAQTIIEASQRQLFFHYYRKKMSDCAKDENTIKQFILSLTSSIR